MKPHDVLDIVRSDRWMLDVLQEASRLELPDWWIGAGFIRSRVWDVLHGYEERSPTADVDLVYFNPAMASVQDDIALELELRSRAPSIPWSVKNQARMHLRNNEAPYRSSADAIAHWPETATCIAVSLSTSDGLKLLAPWGVNDLFHMIVRVSPKFSGSQEDVVSRAVQKGWLDRWPLVRFADR